MWIPRKTAVYAVSLYALNVFGLENEIALHVLIKIYFKIAPRGNEVNVRIYVEDPNYYQRKMRFLSDGRSRSILEE